MRPALPLLLLAALLAPPAARAQNLSDYGSVYSRFGVGERAAFSSSMAEAMGGAGTALRSPFYTGLANPALWADLSFASFGAAADLRGVEATDAADQTSRATAGGVAALALGLPLVRDRLGFTVALRPYSRVEYRAVEEGTFTPDVGDDVAFETNLEGNGGLYQLTAGLGARLAPGLRVGASVDGYFGTLEYLQRTNFDDPTYEETRNTRSTRLGGVSATLGAVATVPGLFAEGDGLHVGAAVALPARLSGERVQTLGFSLDRDTLTVVEEGSVTLPLSARFGVAYASPERWNVAADVLYEPWGAFESDFAFGGFDPAAGLDDLRDRLRVGGGFQVVPAGEERTAGYFARTAYRLGGYAERAFFAPGGTDLLTYALTAGLSFPTVFSAARLDLGIEAGTRGSTDGVLVRDRFVRGTATFNFGERWFLRRPLG
jgi:hypothetical protein